MIRTMSSGPVDPATIRAPGAHLMALEWRAPFEAMSTLALWPLLMRGPRGDGHSVLVLPGLAAPDLSTGVLRRFLSRRGYRPHRWQQGFNFGPRPGVLEACLERVHSLHRSSGRKVSLIGWSLGGVYARELAKMAPDAVRCAISLGTPFAGPPTATNAWRLYEFVSGQRVGEHALHAGLHEAPPVPTTSIYSRTDGVVAWRCSIQAPARHAENIEVRASHVGMGAHPAVLHAVADRLAQSEGDWRPFRAAGLWRPAFGTTTEA
jgi:dienelactone hydrolase